MTQEGSAARHRTVSAVIPTTGRPSLVEAVRSALAQTVPLAKVVVAFDGPRDAMPALPVLPEDPRVEVVPAQSFGRGGNAARMAGISRVDHGLVALLDDDDVWHPRKTELQLSLYADVAEQEARPVVVGCRLRQVRQDGGSPSVVPTRLIQASTPVAAYLFDRTRIREAAGTLNSSMLLFDRSLVDEVPFDVTLARHQDWDWLLRVDQARAAAFVMAPEVLVDYAIAQPGQSISSDPAWRDSLLWALQQPSLSSRQRAEVLLSVTAPIAMKHRQWRGAVEVLLRAIPLGPPAVSLAFCMAHVPLVLERQLRRRLGRVTGRWR